MRNLYESLFHTPTKDEIDTLNMRYAVFTDTYRAFFIKDESHFGERKTHILIFPLKPKIVIDDRLFHDRDILSGIFNIFTDKYKDIVIENKTTTPCEDWMLIWNTNTIRSVKFTGKPLKVNGFVVCPNQAETREIDHMGKDVSDFAGGIKENIPIYIAWENLTGAIDSSPHIDNCKFILDTPIQTDNCFVTYVDIEVTKNGNIECVGNNDTISTYKKSKITFDRSGNINEPITTGKQVLDIIDQYGPRLTCPWYRKDIEKIGINKATSIRPKNYYVIKTNSNELHIKLGEPNAHSISLLDTKTGYENILNRI